MSDPNATPERIRDARELADAYAEALWRLWRGGYIDIADIHAVGSGPVAQAMQKAADGD